MSPNPEPDQDTRDCRSIVLDMLNPFSLRKVTDSVYDVHEKTPPNRKVGQIVQLRPDEIPFCATFTRTDATPSQAIKDFLEYVSINPPWPIKPS